MPTSPHTMPSLLLLGFVCPVLVRALATTILPCTSCLGVKCEVTQFSCETDTIPCGCCPTCVRLVGEVCESFAPRCGTNSKCLTPAGIYDDRPPWNMPFLKGICITDPYMVHSVRK